MIAGCFTNSEYFMGNNLSKEVVSNPHTNFEDIEVNRVNETLLSQVIPCRPGIKIIGNLFFKHRPEMWQRWLTSIPLKKEIPKILYIGKIIEDLTKNEPFCLKDPRFSYVLPIWRPYLNNTVFICVFREPSLTAESIIRLARKASYLKNFRISYKQALNVWRSMYSHIIQIHSKSGQWLFIHYDQAVTEEGINRIEAFVDTKLNHSFPNKSLSQSYIKKSVPGDINQIYHVLCNKASFIPD